MMLPNYAAVFDAAAIAWFLGFLLHDAFKISRLGAFLFALIFSVLSYLSIADFIPADPNVFPPAPIVIMNGFLIALIASFLVPGGRRFWDSIPTHRIVLWHVMRLPAGLAFVMLADAGKLPPEFGYAAGWGDALAGALSVAYALVPALRRKTGVVVWNVVGTLDFIPALGTAALTLNASPFRIFQNGDLMSAVGEFPAELIPTYAAPILLFTHILIYQRKFADRGKFATAELVNKYD